MNTLGIYKQQLIKNKLYVSCTLNNFFFYFYACATNGAKTGSDTDNLSHM